ncbi:MAG: 2-aminoethylphosphonate--pyruvate transaminase, partial [Planctomycetaceae bacterium]
MDHDIPYLLLTPGPLTTTRSVREAMLRDYSTWDVDYNTLVNDVRSKLVRLATDSADFTSILMQGSGTFSVEATLGSVVPPDGRLLVVNNGAYGKRMLTIAERLKIPALEAAFDETAPADPDVISALLEQHPDITHVAMVHCETTTGMLNPLAETGRRIRQHGRLFIVDAMSSFGGIELSMESIGADYLISSANKCVQGVPGFGFVIARRSELERTEGCEREDKESLAGPHRLHRRRFNHHWRVDVDRRCSCTAAAGVSLAQLCQVAKFVIRVCRRAHADVPSTM